MGFCLGATDQRPGAATGSPGRRVRGRLESLACMLSLAREMSLRSPARCGAQPGELGLSSTSPAPWAGPLPPGVTKARLVVGAPVSGASPARSGCRLFAKRPAPPCTHAADTAHASAHAPRLSRSQRPKEEGPCWPGSRALAGLVAHMRCLPGTRWPSDRRPLGPGAPAPQQGLLGTCLHAAEDVLLRLPHAAFLPAFSLGMSRRQTAGQEETRVSTCGH